MSPSFYQANGVSLSIGFAIAVLSLHSRRLVTLLLFVGHGSPMNAIEDNCFTQNCFKKLGAKLPRPKAAELAQNTVIEPRVKIDLEMWGLGHGLEGARDQVHKKVGAIFYVNFGNENFFFMLTPIGLLRAAHSSIMPCAYFLCFIPLCIPFPISIPGQDPPIIDWHSL